jgi:hypothetical protein
VSQAVCLSSDALSYRHLWEFSSSGMSHTFTTFLAEEEEEGEEEGEVRTSGGHKREKNIQSRGWLMDTLFNLYQVRCTSIILVRGGGVAVLVMLWVSGGRRRIQPSTERTGSRTSTKACTSPPWTYTWTPKKKKRDRQQ